jgi:hypothetical protein
MPELFRKRPVVIEAMRITDNIAELATLEEWFIEHDVPAQIVTAWDNTTPTMHVSVHIETLEGDMSADKGDWIIRGVAGEFYPCKPDIFDATYEPVEAPQVILMPSPSACKVAVCEYLLSMNAVDPTNPIIPPTAIDWLGDGIIDAILAAATPKEDDRG